MARELANYCLRVSIRYVLMALNVMIYVSEKGKVEWTPTKSSW